MKNSKKYLVLFCTVLIAVFVFSRCGNEQYINRDYVTKDGSAIYETSTANVNWGEWQCNEEDIKGGIELICGSAVAGKKEIFEENLLKMKKRLDFLEEPYALGLWGEYGSYLKVKINPEKLNVPTLSILNEHSGSIVSQTKDYEVLAVESFDYSLNENNEYVLSVGIYDYDRAGLEKYIKNNLGCPLYFAMGDFIFSKLIITEEMACDKLEFTGPVFAGDETVQTDYKFLLELTKDVINSESRRLSLRMISDENEAE